ncbi:MAG: insulinase family protein, partial [Gemmatimonadota bacterium]|nr:insulinase family protein [Gemmatimonadota bacterium]
MSSPFSTHTLDNGLTLVFETIPRIRSAALGFFAQTGSRDEASDLLGISHFLEHMCFKGTPKRDWRQLSLDVDDLGAM